MYNIFKIENNLLIYLRSVKNKQIFRKLISKLYKSLLNVIL